MTDIHIPPEALEAGAREVHEHGQHAHIAWRDLSDFDRECLRDVSHDCFLAMIEAWPGMWVLHQPMKITSRPGMTSSSPFRRRGAMTAETDAEFVERLYTEYGTLMGKGRDRLFALARRGAAVQWRPISKLDDEMDGTAIVWNKRGWASARNQVLAADICKYSHFIPLSALPPPPAGETNE